MDSDARAELKKLLVVQSGVVSRRQLLSTGAKDHDVRRMLRRRELATVLPGVYIEHTGEPTWLQRAWAAALALAPAALYGSSALRVADGPGRSSHDDTGPIHICIDRDRVVAAPPGVILHRVSDFEGKVMSNTSPPRQRVEEAVVDVAASAESELDAVGALADAVRARLTTADRMADALKGRSRIRRRAFLASVLVDVGTGTCSTLEHGYLDRVERAHGLPEAARQVKASARGTVYRDVEYAAYALRVELDGRVHHSKARDRDLDLDRDLDSAADDDAMTVRLGWGQVFDRPCETAERLARILVRRGWDGEPTPCPECGDEAAEDSGGPLAPGDCDPPLSA